MRRFLNGIQKDHARNEREKNQAKAEVERLNRIAGASSTPSGNAADSSSSASRRVANTSKATASNLSAADQKRQWAQLAEMGIVTPGGATVESATPGTWQAVSQKVVEESPPAIDDKLNIGVRKRKFEDQDEEEAAVDPIARRGWGSATKTYPSLDSTADGLDSLLTASLFKKKGIKRSTDEDVKQVSLSKIESEESVERATPGGKVDAPPLEQAPPHAASSPTTQPFKMESTRPEPCEAELETPTPVFKKRAPRHKASSKTT